MTNKVEFYMYGEALGRSTFGTVVRGLERSTGRQVAIKILSKKGLRFKNLDTMFAEEVNILKRLSHPSVLQMYDCFEDHKNYYIVTELAHGGELFYEIISRVKFTEPDARNVMRQILASCAYIHSIGIAHRDIKPENILYRSKDSGELIIADFGISADVHGDKMDQAVGSLGYAAPEVARCSQVKTRYDAKCDVFSVGVIAYMLLSGFCPFKAETIEEFLEESKRARFPRKHWENVSEAALDFVRLALTADPETRPTMGELLLHPWMTQPVGGEYNLLPNIREGFNGRKKLMQLVEIVKLKNKMDHWKSVPSQDSKQNVFVQLVKTAVEHKETLLAS